MGNDSNKQPAPDCDAESPTKTMEGLSEALHGLLSESAARRSNSYASQCSVALCLAHASGSKVAGDVLSSVVKTMCGNDEADVSSSCARMAMRVYKFSVDTAFCTPVDMAQTFQLIRQALREHGDSTVLREFDVILTDQALRGIIPVCLLGGPIAKDDTVTKAFHIDTDGMSDASLVFTGRIITLTAAMGGTQAHFPTLMSALHGHESEAYPYFLTYAINNFVEYLDTISSKTGDYEGALPEDLMRSTVTALTTIARDTAPNDANQAFTMNSALGTGLNVHGGRLSEAIREAAAATAV